MVSPIRSGKYTEQKKQVENTKQLLIVSHQEYSNFRLFLFFAENKDRIKSFVTTVHIEIIVDR